MHRPSSTRAALVVSALFLAGLTSGLFAGVAAIARAQDPYAGLDRFARVLTVIEREYVDPKPAPALVDAAIDGMVRALDAQSRWLSAEEVTTLREDTAGERTGIGVDLRAVPGGVEIVRVLPGSPAERDGLAPGDRITAVDGEPVAGLPLDEVVAQLQRARGVPARLQVERAGWEVPREVATSNDRIALAAVEGALLAGRIGYVRLVQFQEGAARDLAAEIARIEGAAGGRLAGLVLDLRDNPGGLLSEAVAVADLFLDEGPIVSTRGRAEILVEGSAAKASWAATPGGWPGLPMAVVINGDSASASEIVAAALQDTRRARLFGTPTYGKGTVQQLYRHADGSALKLTVGRYYTASGEPVADREGRAPDVEVAWDEPEAPRARLLARLAEVDLSETDRADLVALAEGLPPDALRPVAISWDSPPAERLRDDPQVRAAIADLARR